MRVAATFDKLVRTLPGELRETARALPHRLGLTATEAGEWTDFVELEPNRNLPVLVAEELAARGVEVALPIVEAFAEAHHVGGFAMLVADRIADGQAAPSPELTRLRHALLRGWGAWLGRALGSRAGGRRLAARALREWRAGVALERALLRRRADWQAYARSSWLKLRWVSATACAMLDHAGCPAPARGLADGYTRFLFALQCRDDLYDREEDAKTRGASIPEALDLPPGALARAAPRIGRRAAEVLRESGFPRMAAWMVGYFRSVDGFLPGGVPLRDEIFGMSLAASFEEQTRAGAS